ncbi:MAG: formimidoylglutamate deiminase [Sphingomonadales bacterium]|nr:formimidoylglutamate deiminase [Sphingomonadales bacterium]
MPAAIHASAALLPDGWADDVRITIADGRVSTVETGTAAMPEDERAGPLVPGLPNLHSHAFQRAMAGLGEVRGAGDDSFWSWREAMYRIAGQVDPEAMAVIAAMAYVEMLECGFTRVGEFHYLHNDQRGERYADPAAMSRAIVAAAAETGMALTLLPVFYAHSGFGGLAPQPGQRRFISSIDSFARLHGEAGAALRELPDGVLGIAPHSLRAVTPDELAELIPLGKGAPIHIHIAEQVREVEDCRAWSGQRPVEWLMDNAPVDSDWCLVHATHMTGNETASLARSGAVAGLCPVTEANLGDGLFPARPYIEADGLWGIGSDSNVLIDAFEELRWVEYGQRLTTQSRNLFATRPGQSTGSALFDAAGNGGARALGVGFGIAAGNAADFVSLDPDHPSLVACPPGQRLDALVFSAGKAAVEGVWRHGRKVVSQGRHHHRDAIMARYASTLKSLLA